MTEREERSRGGPTSPRRVGALLALCVAILTIIALPVPTARAGNGDGDDVEEVPRLELVRQTPWVEPDGSFVVRLRSTAPVAAEGDTVIRVRQAVASRAEFTVGLGEAGPGPLLDEVTIPSAFAIDRADPEQLTLTIATGPGQPLSIDQTGVYPVDVTVDLADGSTVSILTHLVRLPAEDDRPPLRVAVIVPVGAQPILRAGGALRITPQEAARVARRIQPLVDAPDVPLTVVPVPETLDSLARTQRGRPRVTDLAGALDGRQVLSTPYVDLDVTEWVGADLREPLDRQLAAGEAAINDLLGVTPERTARYLAERPTEASLRELREEGADQLVVPSASVPADRRPADNDPFLGPVVLATPTAQMAAAVIDPLLQAHIDRTGDQVLDAHRTLADLATVALDRPQAPAGAVLALPDRGRLAVGYLSTLLEHIGSGPLLPVTVADWFADVAPTPAADDGGAPGETLTLPVADRDLDGLGAYPDDLGVTELTLNGLATLTGGNDPDLEDLNRRVLTSGSSGLNAGQQAAYLSSVGRTIRERTSGIESPDGQTVTLTSRSGRVPVSFRNTTGLPVELRVEVSSDRLEFPEGAQIAVLLVDEVTTIEVPVEARTTGSFQMEVMATSPDGVLAVSATAVKIRSTAVSGVGLILSVGAGLVLLTWWLRHWRDRRRDARLIPIEPEPVRD